MTDPETLYDRLLRLLDEERALLRAGQLKGLADLLPRKEALADELAQTGLPTQAAARLRGELARNQALLDGARAGVREVGARLGAIRALRSTLETYDRNGRRSAVAAPGGTLVEKRA